MGTRQTIRWTADPRARSRTGRWPGPPPSCGCRRARSTVSPGGSREEGAAALVHGNQRPDGQSNGSGDPRSAGLMAVHEEIDLTARTHADVVHRVHVEGRASDSASAAWLLASCGDRVNVARFLKGSGRLTRGNAIVNVGRPSPDPAWRMEMRKPPLPSLERRSLTGVRCVCPEESGAQVGVESGALRISEPPWRCRPSRSKPHHLVV